METKSYYQPNGGFKLENSIYKKTVYTIRSYYILKKRIEDIENKSEIDITEKYSLQGTTQGNGLTGGLPPVRFSM